MRIGGPFDGKGNLILWVVIVGVACIFALFALAGSSPLKGTSVRDVVVGVSVVLTGLLVGMGLVYLATIPLVRRRTEGRRLAPAWTIGLVLVLVLGPLTTVAFDARTVPELTVRSLTGGMAIMAAVRVATLRSIERNGS